MKKTVLAVFVTFAVFAVMAIFTCSLWAGGLPQAKFKGNLAIFPNEDNVPDLDLSKIEFGKGLENIPSEFKFMVGKWWRAQFVMSRLGKPTTGTVWYMNPNNFDGEKTSFIIAHNQKGFRYILLCPVSGKDCYISNAKAGSTLSFARYKLIVKEGRPFCMVQGIPQEAEFYEAGDIPEEIWKK